MAGKEEMEKRNEMAPQQPPLADREMKLDDEVFGPGQICESHWSAAGDSERIVASALGGWLFGFPFGVSVTRPATPDFLSCPPQNRKRHGFPSSKPSWLWESRGLCGFSAVSFATNFPWQSAQRSSFRLQ